MKLKNRKQFIVICVGLGIALFFGFCIHYDGPYKGKVLDLETGEPIEGVVVAARWTIEPFVHTERICDAKETITDKNGEFELPKGKCVSHLFADMYKPRVVVFKPGCLGYPPLGNNPEERRAKMPDFTGYEFRNTGQYYIIKLGKPTTRKEREWTLSPAESLLDEETYENLPILLRLVNEENKNLGLGEIGPVKSKEG